jgi:hypothetical protein
VLQKILVQRAMGNDFQASARVVLKLNIAEICTLKLDGGIEYLVKNGAQIGGVDRRVSSSFSLDASSERKYAPLSSPPASDVGPCRLLSTIKGASRVAHALQRDTISAWGPPSSMAK